MRVIVFGATGMVGKGVLLECLRDDRVTHVLAIGRRPVGLSHPKLAEHIRHDFFDWSDGDETLAGYDACFFTLGVSAAGMEEADYTRLTFDLTLAAATALARLNPAMTFKTLRANPALPARRIVDPRENASHAASSRAVSSNAMSDGAAVPGCDRDAAASSCTPNGGSPGARAASAGSDVVCEKRIVKGHTSWVLYRLTRFKVKPGKASETRS